MGETGRDGVVGFIGPKGYKGMPYAADSIMRPQPGYDGLKGEKGEIGDKGYAGRPGLVGYRGLKGNNNIKCSFDSH